MALKHVGYSTKPQLLLWRLVVSKNLQTKIQSFVAIYKKPKHHLFWFVLHFLLQPKDHPDSVCNICHLHSNCDRSNKLVTSHKEVYISWFWKFFPSDRLLPGSHRLVSTSVWLEQWPSSDQSVINHFPLMTDGCGLVPRPVCGACGAPYSLDPTVIVTCPKRWSS